MQFHTSKPTSPSLKIISLGGFGRVTSNMFVYEYENDILLVDCGMGFPSEDMLGVDILIPDISYFRGKEKNIRGVRAIMAWIHLIGMNVGGAATTISMILAGLMGSGALDLILSAGSTTELHQNLAIMDQFIPPIATFAGVLSIGVIVGGISYISSYLQKNNTTDKT